MSTQQPAYRGGADGPDGDVGPSSATNLAIERVLRMVLQRRQAGEALADATMAATYPELMPELGERLRRLGMFQRAFAAGLDASARDSELIAAPAAELAREVAPSGLDIWDEDAVKPKIARHTVLREMATGGQATVFEASQDATGRRVAVKLLPGGRFASSENRERFDREANILSQLDHPNIVTIIDRGRTDAGSFYFVMPYVTGIPLDRYAAACRVQGMDGMRRLIDVFIRLAGAVGDAHAHGVVHRDIKPSNVLVDARGEPHLLDFGMARLARADGLDGGADWRVRTITLAGQVVGSLPWASPEQVSGKSLDLGPASDVYSFGVCLQQCLTGAHPYSLEGSIADMIARIRTVHPARMGAACGDASAALQDVVDRCLAKDEADRYRDGETLANALRVAAGWHLAAGVPAAERKPNRRRRRWAMTGAVGCAVCLVVALASSHTGPQPKQAEAVSERRPIMRNSIGMRLVGLPSGEFWMGSPLGAKMRGGDERIHKVKLSRSFWFGAHAVTREEYARVLGATELPRGAAEGASGALPVTGITWAQATRFCAELSKMDGGTYRLPTEAEWEYACRAGIDAAGPNDQVRDEAAWHSGNSDGAPRDVGSGVPNAWGIYDLQGNVGEWCEDFYSSNYPITPTDPVVREDLGWRVVRGGSYARPASEARSAARRRVEASGSFADVGFRVVKEK